MSSQITVHSGVCSTVCFDQHQRNIIAPRHRPFVKGMHQWHVDSTLKGPSMLKALPFHDVMGLISSSGYKWRLRQKLGKGKNELNCELHWWIHELLGHISLTWMNLNPARISKYTHYTARVKLLIHFQILTVASLKSGDGQELSSTLFWSGDYLSMLCFFH